MIELNFVLEVIISLDLQDIVQVISLLAEAYRDFAAAQLLLSASKVLRKTLNK